jgi:23S rRNA (cytosine1962-C5)-methyltransferase
MNILNSSYSLIDSGNGRKLEKFGDKVINRASSLAFWKPRLDKAIWQNAAAIFDPKKETWTFSGDKFDYWDIEEKNLKLRLRLQTNGQVGLFPEHASYLYFLQSLIQNANIQKPSVLNLFAYTGLASSYLAKHGAEVCHVDSSKKVLTWAKENLELNQIPNNSFRLIPEDACEFLKREVRRNKEYDVIIMDPPSFSRGNKTKAWQLENIIYDLIADAIKLLRKRKGILVFSCHHSAIQGLMLSNVLVDFRKEGLEIIKVEDLAIGEQNNAESDSIHKLPAGACAIAKLC